MNVVTITSPDDPLLERFHRGIYGDAFAAQHEPLAAWRTKLGTLLTVRLALDHDEIVAGICFEHYPRSRCGLVTSLVVAPDARGHGLGDRLLRDATQTLYDAGAPAVFGAIVDHRGLWGNTHDMGDSREASIALRRLEWFQRGGARVADLRYIQPALGPGLYRDTSLILLVLAGAAPVPPTLPGDIVRGFIDELYQVTEGGRPDERIVVGAQVPLVVMRW